MDPVNRPPEYSQLGPRHLPPRRAPGQTQERRQRRWCSATTPSRRSRIWRATGRRSPAPKIIRDREVVRSLDYPRSRDTRDRDEMRREYPNTHTHTHTPLTHVALKPAAERSAALRPRSDCARFAALDPRNQPLGVQPGTGSLQWWLWGEAGTRGGSSQVSTRVGDK